MKRSVLLQQRKILEKINGITMANLITKEGIYTPFTYALEKDFERVIVEHSREIFGTNSIYIDVKKKIKNNNIVTIPDGYLIDFSFELDPRLYIIENELSTHDPSKHIGEQLLKFAVSYKTSGRKIKAFLLENLLKNEDSENKVVAGFQRAGYRNIDDFLEQLIYEKPVATIVITDGITPDLENVLNQLTMKTDIIEFQSYKNGNNIIHKFDPFQNEVRIVEAKSRVKIEDIDTIVVPANEEGFNEVFLGQNCWYSIRISSYMLERIKYIAGYQTNPVSAITYYAEVSKIEKYKDSSKYILYFTNTAKKIGPIRLQKNDKSSVPQSSRYTSFKKLKKAKSMKDVF